MSAYAKAPIVVGVDDTPLGLSAVRMATREAARYERPLRIVHSFNWSPELEAPPANELRRPTELLLDRAATTARSAEPRVEISTALIEGPALTTLLRESGSAALTVIGDGELTCPDAVPADTLSVQIAARAGCSVLVVRESPPDQGPVLVGFDGSGGSYAALDFGFDAAARRGTELLVLRAWDPEEHPHREAPTTEQLAEAVRPCREKYPSVRVTERVRVDDPEQVLIAESRQAQLVVVSARGDQPWRGMLGSVSQALLYHSPVPVAVVRSAHELYIQE
ncbi:universal stress protein [Micromonospora sp. NPDC049559]|uniref:universal stress protein n=1 Tax=Micromonospora sp. NPDC049559 TaxID=3155923 RepID=UPI0034210FBE